MRFAGCFAISASQRRADLRLKALIFAYRHYFQHYIVFLQIARLGELPPLWNFLAVSALQRLWFVLCKTRFFFVQASAYFAFFAVFVRFFANLKQKSRHLAYFPRFSAHKQRFGTGKSTLSLACRKAVGERNETQMQTFIRFPPWHFKKNCKKLRAFREIRLKKSRSKFPPPKIGLAIDFLQN